MFRRTLHAMNCVATAVSAAMLMALATPCLAFETPVARDDIDPEASAQWVDGQERRDVEFHSSDKTPSWVVWTRDSAPGHSGVTFGMSDRPGARHLRIGFKKPIPMGTIFTVGDVELSVLKPGAQYPGRLDAEDDWLPAARLRRDEISVWVLPPGTQSRAMRFTVTTGPNLERHYGWLGGVYVLADRFANVAPRAAVIASASPEKTERLANGRTEGWWDVWDNGNGGAKEVVSPERPEWIMLVWPRPVTLRGLCGIWAGFGQAQAEGYAGPADVHPREAEADKWRDLGTFSCHHQYPRSLGVNWFDFGQAVTTRAVRLRIIKPDVNGHPHVAGPPEGGKTLNGRRVWLGELLALDPLGDAAVETALPAAAEEPRPPIPVRFSLDKPSFVSLVIEDEQGRRVRNLVSETRFDAGEHTLWWDGLDETGVGFRYHGIYDIQGRLVPPGKYQVRGLKRDQVDLIYEFTVYNAGHPPWRTADGKGQWLADHSPPTDVLFLPGDAPQVLIASFVAESGDGLVWTDLEGRKLSGRRTLGMGGGWCGAQCLARDAGDSPAPASIIFLGVAWEDHVDIWSLSPQAKRVYMHKFGKKEQAALGGLAARNGLVAASLPKVGQALLVDAKEGKLLATMPLEDGRGLAFDGAGRLLALSGKRLLRYAPLQPAGGTPPPKPDVLVPDGLDDPQRLALDGQGNIYVSDWGASHQVKVFSPDGKPVRAIGKAGAPAAGPYDPEKMRTPNGLAITSDGRLWVAESDITPKRVSLWTLDGKFVKALYGPSQYGGGGNIDPHDRTRFYYAQDGCAHGMEFRLDWEKGTSELSRIIYLPGQGDLALPDAGPQTPIYCNGRQYMTNAFNSNPTNGTGLLGLWVMRDGLAVPVAAVGQANYWDLLKGDAFKPRLPEGASPTKSVWESPVAFAWSDLNGDAQVQPEEVTFAKEHIGSIYVCPDLTLVTSYSKVLKPRSFTDKGAPVYDLIEAKKLVEAVPLHWTSGGAETFLARDGWLVVTGGPMRGYQGGELLWTYPSQWPSLHGSHEAPLPSRPGEMIGTTRIVGQPVTPRGSDAGEIWGTNGNFGTVSLMTTDGLFVATLGKDSRTAPPWAMPRQERWMKLSDVSFGEEHFWPTLNQTADGNIYLVAGHNHASIVRVDGLGTIRRIPAAPLEVTAQMAAECNAYFIQRDAARIERQGRNTLPVPILEKALEVDGDLAGWDAAAWVDVDEKSSAAVAVAADRLTVALRTQHQNLLDNTGETPHTLFKTGGAIDLMIGADSNADPARKEPARGDVRLLVTMVKGKPMAMLYRPVAPGAKEPVKFSSPWRSISMDEVQDVSDQVALAGKGGNYEVSVPLKLLGLEPAQGLVIRADVGILVGSHGMTIRRSYWHNKATSLTSDIPGEAMLTPQLWGRWKFEKR